MQLQDDCPANHRRMFNRFGWVDAAPVDAIAAATQFPGDWTLQPWRRPEGTEYINIPQNWDTLGSPDRIRLARETGARIDPTMETAAQVAEADSIISKYLAGTTHPDAKPAPAPATPAA
jgi:hypothetical protein